MSWLFPTWDKAPDLHQVTISYTFPEKQVYVLNQGEKIIYWVVMRATHVLKHLRFLAIVLLSCSLFMVEETVKKT